MLLGGYSNGDSGRPLIQAFVNFPDLGTSCTIDFLVDTGADVSMIGSRDCAYYELTPLLDPTKPGVRISEKPVLGIVGAALPFLVRAELTFNLMPGPVFVHGKDFEELDVLTPEMAKSDQVPSLLGWDVLGDLSKLGFCRAQGQLFFLAEGEYPPANWNP